jgi:tetratricopeptide (TPR) repeat protein
MSKHKSPARLSTVPLDPLMQAAESAWSLRISDPKAAHDAALQIQRDAEATSNTIALISALRTIGFYQLKTAQYDDAAVNAHLILHHSETLTDKRFAVDALNLLGNIAHAKGDFKDALQHYKQAYKLSQQTAMHYAELILINNIGVILNLLGKSAEAMRFFRRSHKLSEEQGDLSGISSALMNIGNIQLKSNDVQSALTAFHQSLKIQEMLGNSFSQAIVLNIISQAHAKLRDYEKALDADTRALALQQANNDKRGEAHSLNHIGLLFELLGDVKNALTYYLRGLEIREAIGVQDGLAESYFYLGKLMLKLHDAERAIDLLKKSIDFHLLLEIHTHLFTALDTLIEAYTEQGNLKAAEQTRRELRRLKNERLAAKPNATVISDFSSPDTPPVTAPFTKKEKRSE